MINKIIFLELIKLLVLINSDFIIAGWSSLVARQAHNLKVLGSNPSPATNYIFRLI
jgi:hypothetical protein